jgi:hypothetical protein
MHPRLGNLRESSFRELWNSPQAQKARNMIRTRQCACANERCLGPSLLYQPAQLMRARLLDSLRDQPLALPVESPLAYASVRSEPTTTSAHAESARAKHRRLPIVDVVGQ